MNIELAKTILAFVVLINPLGALGFFLDVTKGCNAKERQKVAQIACATVLIAMCVFTIFGEAVLNFLGISVGSFRVAGGILLFLIAIHMMNGGGNPAKPNQDEVGVGSSLSASAVVPLAIPMMIGPGGISTVIIYSSQVQSMTETAIILAASAVISLFCYVSLMMAGKISRFLGETGLNILSRIMGMLLAAVAVEILVSGLRAIFPQLLG